MIKIHIETKPHVQNRISRHIYGHFAEHLGRCIYDGLWVGPHSKIANVNGIRKDIIEALKKIKIPNLRWPGGCFADAYHWKDGIGPQDLRPKTVNAHWGNVIENNHYGTHEFLETCELLGCEPYISGNVGSGTVKEMFDWIEYLTFDGDSTMANLRQQNGRQKPWRIKYWGIGNENWQCGGNMTARYYTDLLLRYSEYCQDFSGNKLYKVACGPPGEFELEWCLNWVETILKKTKHRLLTEKPIIEGISLHYYTRAGGQPAIHMNPRRWMLAMKNALNIETPIIEIIKLMDKYDPLNRLGLIIDEWGTWWGVEKGTNPHFLYQQNTLADALIAALHLDIFNRHCDRIQAANIAQTVNVLQAMVLTKDEQMVLTPTYHIFDMYKHHQENTLLPMKFISNDNINHKFKLPAINGSASVDDKNNIFLSLTNLNPEKNYQIECNFSESELNNTEIAAKILTSEYLNAHNTFDTPDNLKPAVFPTNKFTWQDNHLIFELPSKSVLFIQFCS